MRERIFTWVFLFLVLSGCGNGVTVETAFDQKAPLSSYQTFAMMLPNDAVRVPGNVDPFKMLRIRQLTYGQLIARGFKAVEKKKADFLVAVNAGTTDKVEVYSSSGLYGAGYPSDARPYTEGTLVIELVNAKRKTVEWHGRAKSRVSSSTSDERLAEIIGAILNEFPPGRRP